MSGTNYDVVAERTHTLQHLEAMTGLAERFMELYRLTGNSESANEMQRQVDGAKFHMMAMRATLSAARALGEQPAPKAEVPPLPVPDLQQTLKNLTDVVSAASPLFEVLRKLGSTKP